MTTPLRILLAAHLLFFGAWGGQLLTSHRDVAVVWLATEPVDPRDLLSGHYVALRYPMTTATRIGCDLGSDGFVGGMVFVRLEAGADAIQTAEGYVVPSEAAGCSTTPPLPGSGTWIAGRVDTGGVITYGIERMFVGENDPLRQATSGSVVAKVAVNDNYEGRLLALVTKHTPTAPAAE